MKVLGIDYGLARIGLAVSDSSEKIAFTYKTLQNKQKDKTLAELTTIIQEQHIEKIVIGLPLDKDGSKTNMSDIIEVFSNDLTHHLEQQNIHIPVLFINEALTSFSAYDTLLSFGTKHTKIKQTIDQEAARSILQEYLDRHE